MSRSGSTSQPGRWAWQVAKLFLLVLLCLMGGCLFVIEAPLVLAFGWVGYLIQAIPRVHVNGSAVATFLVALAGLTVLGHTFACWLHRSWRGGPPPDVPPSTWRWRWTLGSVTIVMLAFVAGIAAVGAIHQAAWFAATRPLLTSTFDYSRDGDQVEEICAHVWWGSDGTPNRPPAAMSALWSLDRSAQLTERWEVAARADSNGTLAEIMVFPRDADDLRRSGGFVCRAGHVANRFAAATLGAQLEPFRRGAGDGS